MTDPVNRPVRLAGLAGVVAVGLVLAGCSGDGGEGASSSAAPSATEVSTGSASPTGTGSDSASPSSSASGSYEPATETSPATNVPIPEMPEAAKEPTQEGLESAVEYWWTAGDFLRATGESTYIDEVSTSDCGLCQSQRDRWAEIYDLGGWAETGPTEVGVQFTNIDNGGLGGTGAIVVSESPSQIYQPNGSQGGSGDGSEDRPWAFSAVFDEEEQVWKIEGLEPQG
ncbi:DUF6318 family protein [Citricoccus nitrophenolicus]